MCPFQYGVDFGIIGSLQAMKGFLEVCFLYCKRSVIISNYHQVFGHEDPLSPTGWNISPGRQQLISSLMILGAFVASSAAGMSCDRF
jgi:MFS transporter, SP family, sugar:H+ symporter